MTEDGATRLGPELRMSPKSVSITLAVLGLALTIAGDSVPGSASAATLKSFALVLYGLGALTWLLDTWSPVASRWATVLAVIVTIILAATWLNTPEALILLSIPVVLAALMIDIVAGTSHGVFVSLDDGRSWECPGRGPAAPPIFPLAQSPDCHSDSPMWVQRGRIA